jgi:hypothetical protein
VSTLAPEAVGLTGHEAVLCDEVVVAPDEQEVIVWAVRVFDGDNSHALLRFTAGGHSRRTLMPIRTEGPRRVWNLLTSQTFSFGASLLHIEVAQVSIGAPNEYFLRHRRRRRSACYCRIPWCARLNKKFGGPALKHRDAVEIAQQA